MLTILLWSSSSSNQIVFSTILCPCQERQTEHTMPKRALFYKEKIYLYFVREGFVFLDSQWTGVGFLDSLWPDLPRSGQPLARSWILGQSLDRSGFVLSVRFGTFRVHILPFCKMMADFCIIWFSWNKRHMYMWIIHLCIKTFLQQTSQAILPSIPWWALPIGPGLGATCRRSFSKP